jgi:tetratricopeptide (TPR) repeat protein
LSAIRGTLARWAACVALVAVLSVALGALDAESRRAARQDRLYFPSGRALVESSVGFREVAADYLWFRFVQYFGSYAKGNHDLRYFDLLVDAITRLDPRFVEAYHFASLVAWSELGDFEKSIDLLKRGILANPESAKLHFQVGFTYYVFFQDYRRSATWFEAAARCPDGGETEARFAAFARYRAGDDRVSLELWKEMAASTESPQMRELAEKMVEKLERKLTIQKLYGPDFIGPIPEL